MTCVDVVHTGVVLQVSPQVLQHSPRRPVVLVLPGLVRSGTCPGIVTTDSFRTSPPNDFEFPRVPDRTPVRRSSPILLCTTHESDVKVKLTRQARREVGEWVRPETLLGEFRRRCPVEEWTHP